MAEANFGMPVPLDLNYTNLTEAFTKWKRELHVYLTASGASDTCKSKKVQTAIVLQCAGPQVIQISQHFEYAEASDKDNPEKLLEHIEIYCMPKKNEVLHTIRFWNAPFTEPFDTFLTELRSLADSCGFKEKERMIRDKIIFTMIGSRNYFFVRVTISL